MNLNYDEFYPTPPALVYKMLDGLNLALINSVLEPSAGKGDIADIVVNRLSNAQYSYDSRMKDYIDCIEINPDLQGILRDKKYRVVHNNFLTYRTHKHYDLIIMNPPFSEGDKHLMHALNMIKDGGTVICILNAETLRNCHTNLRKLLRQRLDELGAKIEYLEGAFEQAERKTSVEIALVKVEVPEPEGVSFIFERLRKKEYAEVDEECTDLVGGDFLAQIIKQYEIEVEAGIKLIREYNSMRPYIMDSFDKNKSYSKPTLSLKVNNESATVNEYVKAVRVKYWNELFQNNKFVGKLTSNLCSELYEKVDELKNFDFSAYNIERIQEEIMQMMSRGIEETIMNLFDKLSEQHSWYPECAKNIHYYSGWATNKAHKINKKVIIPIHGAFSSYSWNRDELQTYNVYEVMSDIEKTLTYLSTGDTYADDDLQERLQIASNNGQTKKIPLKYFNITLYKKGTCHIEFTDLELLDRLNIYGSRHKGWLPPSYGKKQYEDMTQEEKTVIDDFQGAEAYRRVMAEPERYIIETNKILQLGAAD